MDLATAQEHFRPERCHLDTATYGLAPIGAVEALRADVDRWASARLDVVGYDALVDRCRVAFAELVGARATDVAIVSQLSMASAMVAGALGPGDEVLVAAEDFTSLLFPLLRRRTDGVEVRVVPLDEVLGEIRGSTTLVAVSAVQSADGRVFDLDALAGAVSGTATMTFIDATQAAGWLPIGADRFSVVAASAYKWLCSPRGSGFMAVHPDLVDRIAPVAANWYSAEHPWDTAYGAPLRLASGARRFDLSPAWPTWVGAVHALELLAAVGVETVHDHDVALANAFAAGFDLPAAGSAIVAFDQPGADERLRRADIGTATRAGRTRLSFHLYNTGADVDRVLNALTG